LRGEIGRPKGKENQPIGEPSIKDVDHKVDNVVPGDIKTIELVIERKGEMTQNSRPEGMLQFGQEIKRLHTRWVSKILQILNGWIVDNITRIIEYKRGTEGIGIDQQSQDSEHQDVYAILFL
jgi:hypothetical protein